MAGYLSLNEYENVHPRLSRTFESYSYYSSYTTTDQQRHGNISTVAEANPQSRHAIEVILPVKLHPGFKAISQQATSKLQHPITLKATATGSNSVTFSTKDKLAIIFRYRNKYVVCRKCDSTVTVLTDPDFKTKNPTIIYDGYEKGDILNNVKMILMFAVAKTAHHSSEIHFKFRDLILVLAKSRGVYLGISPSGQVGFFPREKVVFITKPRICIYPGLIIKVQAITDMVFERLTFCRGKLYSVCKGNDDHFDWRLPSSQLRIPLERFREHDIEGFEPLPAVPSQRQDPYYNYERDGGYDHCFNSTDANGEDSYAESLTFEDGDDEYKDFDITTDNYADALHEDIQNNETVKPTIPLSRARPPKARRKEHAKECEEYVLDKFSRLYPYRDVKISEDLKGIIAEYVDDDVWHELGREIGVTKNKRREIESQKETIYDKTYDLLGIWHKNSGCNASIGVLLDALIKVNPEDLDHILEKTLKKLEDGNNVYENLPYTVQEDKPQPIPKDHEIEQLLDKLSLFRNVGINDELRAVVAECVEDEVFQDLGKQMKIPRIKIRDIERQKDTTYDKTYHLLGKWHEKFDSDANVGFLLDALVEVNPVDLKLILEDMLRKLSLSDARELKQYEGIPDKETTASKKLKYERIQPYMNRLRNYPDVEINNEVRDIVSQYIDKDVWHELGRILEISKNMREKIEAKRKDIHMKVYDLLGQWHQMLGSDATIHALLNALEKVNPEDLHLILKDLSKALDLTD